MAPEKCGLKCLQDQHHHSKVGPEPWVPHLQKPSIQAKEGTQQHRAEDARCAGLLRAQPMYLHAWMDWGPVSTSAAECMLQLYYLGGIPKVAFSVWNGEKEQKLAAGRCLDAVPAQRQLQLTPCGVLQLEWTLRVVPSWAEMARPSHSCVDELSGKGFSRK